ncbi:NADP-dependent malic enzyme [Choanephora cucurbitarum]|uniref:Malic enzyme n=1 Tax=Choanephora cucurbitarum TaxID=101091 RepID=A0A1C7NG65_9FUNG|nr:NADP-dependent malic enzyme [Choanephora cucurbitarum]
MSLFVVTTKKKELAPVVYTPTVGEACLKYSEIYPFLNPPGAPDGLCITLDDLSRLDDILESYKLRSGQTPDITVMTDGSRILGLGDLGINGMPICMGKLQLYVASAGIHPHRTLPVTLDFGTNNEAYLTDEHYMGVRKKRPDDSTFYEAVNQVLFALRRVFPDIVVQFEDFSSAHAFGLLKRHRSQLACFNDDIQGTGVVVLAGLINAFRKVARTTNLRIQDHRIVFHGAGSAAIGVARQIQRYLETEHGVSEEEAKRIFYFCDSKGLITLDRGDTLAEHKVDYARKDNQGQQYRTLEEIVSYARPTALLGFSSVAHAFTSKVLSLMHQLNERPIIFPLSNPANKAECSFKEAMKATDNKAIFASGTAFPAYIDPETKKKYIPGQGNNMFVFPGLGLGSILSKTTSVSDDMLNSAAKALANSLTPEEVERGLIYPSLARIREVSSVVATAVIEQTMNEKLAKIDQIPEKQIKSFVESHMWSPEVEPSQK